MTAPLIVATWISLQYYASTVDPSRLGAGNKVLHNVVGSLGVVEGNHGDLRVGLPMQSVHDGSTAVHDPVRLSAIIEAPVWAMNAILARNPELADLADNRWFHLFAMNDEGVVTHRYMGGGEWTDVWWDEDLDADGRQVAC